MSRGRPNGIEDSVECLGGDRGQAGGIAGGDFLPALAFEPTERVDIDVTHDAPWFEVTRNSTPNRGSRNSDYQAPAVSSSRSPTAADDGAG